MISLTVFLSLLSNSLVRQELKACPNYRQGEANKSPGWRYTLSNIIIYHIVAHYYWLSDIMYDCMSDVSLQSLWSSSPQQQNTPTLPSGRWWEFHSQHQSCQPQTPCHHGLPQSRPHHTRSRPPSHTVQTTSHTQRVMWLRLNAVVNLHFLFN